jgi:glycine dehydrogenase subunit 1
MLLKLPHITDSFKKPFFKEFTLKTTLDVHQMNKVLSEEGYLGPFNQGDFNSNQDGLITFSVTEKRTKEEIDHFIDIMGAL